MGLRALPRPALLHQPHGPLLVTLLGSCPEMCPTCLSRGRGCPAAQGPGPSPGAPAVPPARPWGWYVRLWHPCWPHALAPSTAGGGVYRSLLGHLGARGSWGQHVEGETHVLGFGQGYQRTRSPPQAVAPGHHPPLPQNGQWPHIWGLGCRVQAVLSSQGGRFNRKSPS